MNKKTYPCDKCEQKNNCGNKTCNLWLEWQKNNWDLIKMSWHRLNKTKK